MTILNTTGDILWISFNNDVMVTLIDCHNSLIAMINSQGLTSINETSLYLSTSNTQTVTQRENSERNQ